MRNYTHQYCEEREGVIIITKKKKKKTTYCTGIPFSQIMIITQSIVLPKTRNLPKAAESARTLDLTKTVRRDRTNTITVSDLQCPFCKADFTHHSHSQDDQPTQVIIVFFFT